MRKFYEFEFDGKRPSDFGRWIKVKTHDISYPSKTKITATVPFSSTVYDFSAVGGDQAYDTRKVTFVINVLKPDGLDPVSMHSASTALVNWLSRPVGEIELRDDKLPGWHFLGEVQSAPSLADAVRTGEMTVEFECYPFMIRDTAAGDDRWNDFAFDTDVAQVTEFDVDGEARVILINNGAQAVSPIITADAEMTVEIVGVEYKLQAGVNEGLPLPIGENWLLISGTGHISFDWHQEVI